MESWQRNLYAAWLAQFIAILGFSFVLPFLPLYVQTLGIETLEEAELWSGLLWFGAGVAMAVSAPFWGVLADRVGRKVMVERSMFAGALFVAGMGLASDVNQLLVLRIMQGAFTGTVSASIALVSTVVPRERIGYSLGLMQMAVFAGASIGPLIGGVLADVLGFRVSFALTGALLALAGLLVLFLVDEPFEPRKADGHLGLSGFLDGIRLTLSSRSLLPLVVVIFSIQVSVQIIGPILPLFVKTLSGEGEYIASTSGAIIAAAGVASAASAIVVGRLSDRVGYRRVLILAAAVAGIIYIPQAFVRSGLELLVLRGILGLFIGCMLPTANALIGLLTPMHRRGSVYGVTASAGAWGQAFGPMLGASVAAGLGIRSVFLVTAAVLVLLSLWVRVAVREPEARVETELEEVSPRPPSLIDGE
ncbi:MAG: MFS transporter [Chloroflexota bacterium]